MVVDSVEGDTRPLSGARRAWLATGIAIPLHAMLALILGSAASAIFGALVTDPTGDELVLVSGVFVAIEHILTVVLGIVLAVHTVGRWLDARTRDWEARRAAWRFAALGAALSLLPGAIFFVDGQYPLANAVLVLVGLTVPFAATAGLTRLIMPLVEDGQRPRLVWGLAIAAVILTVIFAAVVILGVPILGLGS
ncbi:hypothetical protein [Demequina salsinemoris]|uniref:hypothetical protein n=1 Tax=Demequina salsinemoris TaxID=577470 RepID=UPI00078405AB|nr:hypothetical protein [Demequina salsinemoris]